VDVRGLGGGTAAARRLAEVNVLLSEIGCPEGEDPSGAIRIGTQSITSQGFTPGDMPAIGSAIARGLHEPSPELRAEVAEIRRKHPP
jgi:glycine/serine hydroxymethyltransferase